MVDSSGESEIGADRGDLPQNLAEHVVCRPAILFSSPTLLENLVITPNAAIGAVNPSSN
ncbi:hypothetical protein TIFTF001_016091 [Ficus carica]|uniref:Uncharacterized protein n=1 Tax=Ficus carica TaxID=3494 RepID=A0AA88D5U2_FICCA|nr:hypothetical protein TIFTF001_016091 [Ficus carica]